MRLAQTLAALLLFSSLFFSCTVDDINEDDAITKVEDVYADGGGGHSPPDDDQGNNQ